MAAIGDRRDGDGVGLSSLLQDLLAVVPGRAATLYTPDLGPARPGGIWQAVGMPAQALTDYAARFQEHDPWAWAMSRSNPPPTGAIIDTDRLVDAGDLLRSALHNEYLARYDIGRGLVAIVDDGRGAVLPRIHMTVVRAPSEPRFTAMEADRMAQLVRLARSFVRLSAARDDAVRAELLQRSTLDLLRMPVVLVDADRRVVTANRSAAGLLRAGAQLHQRQGRLHARTPAADRELGSALRLTAADPADVRFVRLGPGRRSPALMIATLQGDQEWGHDRVLVVGVLDPASDTAGDDGATVLNRLLDLTAAECAVALGIAEGLAHDEIARRRGVKVTTVRTTLRRVQEKLGIQKTAPLARFIHAVTALGGLGLKL